jgi:hypothetical protein
MNPVLADLGLILLLILMNGFFVAVEIAYVSVRRTRLSELADEGDKRAVRALRLLRDPGRFLAVIQVAITFLGALASAVAAHLEPEPRRWARRDRLPQAGPQGFANREERKPNFDRRRGSGRWRRGISKKMPGQNEGCRQPR